MVFVAGYWIPRLPLFAAIGVFALALGIGAFLLTRGSGGRVTHASVVTPYSTLPATITGSGTLVHVQGRLLVRVCHVKRCRKVVATAGASIVLTGIGNKVYVPQLLGAGHFVVNLPQGPYRVRAFVPSLRATLTEKLTL